MGSNHIENAFLDEAVKNLKRQYERVYPEKYNGRFGLGCGVMFMLMDGGKLTLALPSYTKKLTPDPNITPVDCYNLINPGEDLATAVNRVFRSGNGSKSSSPVEEF